MHKLLHSIMEIIFKYNFRMDWKQITYQKQTVSTLPSQRWGHRLVKTITNQLVLFGGFGGSSTEGVYLSDLWTFSTSTHSWQQLHTQGQVPQNRSNYTLHYSPVSDQIVLYGGGAHNRTRYNSVCVLDWKTKVWAQYMPEEATEAPWERTYHTSEFCYPYLIVHGGQGVANLDLDDMWVFNVIDKKWRRIGFDAAGVPRKRRFHSSALVGSYMYIMGGCTGNFQLLGDMYRVNLASLFERQSFDNFHWETLVRKDKLLERWGHSSEVYNGVIYTSCGRISPSQDSNDTFTFDPQTKTLAKVEANSLEIVPRRRHASAIVGNSLLLFGGYNGKYLNDFYYLPLDNQVSVQTSIKFGKIMFESTQELEIKLKEYESRYEADLTIEVKTNQESFSLNTNRNKLICNPFMNSLLKCTQQEQPIIQLPEFCDITTFRLLHSAIVQKDLILSKRFNIESLANLIKSNQYFICCEANSAIEAHLIQIVDQTNCLEILQLATYFHLINAQKSAARSYLSLKKEQQEQKKTKFEGFMRSNNLPHAFSPEQESRESNNTKDSVSTTSSILQQVYEHIKFELQQQKLKQKNSTIFEKAAKHIKIALGRSKSKSQTAKGKDEKQKGCFAKFTNFFSGFFMNAKVSHGEIHH